MAAHGRLADPIEARGRFHPPLRPRFMRWALYDRVWWRKQGGRWDGGRFCLHRLRRGWSHM